MVTTVLSVPRAHRPAFERLAALSDATMALVIEVLEKHPGNNLQSFEDALATIDGGAFPDTFFDALVSASSVRSSYDWSADRVAREIANFSDLDVPSGERPKLQERLSSLIQLKSVTRVAKAYDLFNSYPASVDSVRILTDIRPLFDNVRDSPPSALIAHMLEVTYVDDAGHNKRSQYSLDSSDLESLASWVTRAQAKEETLTAWLGRLDAQVFVIQADNDESDDEGKA